MARLSLDLIEEISRFAMLVKLPCSDNVSLPSFYVLLALVETVVRVEACESLYSKYKFENESFEKCSKCSRVRKSEPSVFCVGFD